MLGIIVDDRWNENVAPYQRDAVQFFTSHLTDKKTIWCSGRSQHIEVPHFELFNTDNSSTSSPMDNQENLVSGDILTLEL